MRANFALAFSLALATSAWAPAWAMTEAPFTQPAFAAAQAAHKPILIEIDASWCPTCAQQRPILGRLMNDPAFRDVTIYKVDFDTQKDIVRAMGATMQSTLIAFHGATETGRSVGETNPDAIKALVATTTQ